MATPAMTPRRSHVVRAVRSGYTLGEDCLSPRCPTFSSWPLSSGCSGSARDGKGLVLDGDTGWHIRTGEYILQNGTVPHQDIFSYSKPGAPGMHGNG